MPPSERLLEYKKVHRLRSGGFIIIYMDVFEILPHPQVGLFLEKFKISWVAFDLLEPSHKVLVDSHNPKGLHHHLSDGGEEAVEATSLREAILFFEQKVESHFGELEEKIYENIHI